ncbi:hypothetical protein EYF80_057418 [Liparis tanakae]|uniref:Uncharacterized protein n=1 Tax=Liparis tanakae TaxID=230148 RepID=A0A4Z2EUH9_9TELE|nr:hypothetical protein EYF80_057418 [Liparis tanakae]
MAMGSDSGTARSVSSRASRVGLLLGERERENRGASIGRPDTGRDGPSGTRFYLPGYLCRSGPEAEAGRRVLLLLHAFDPGAEVELHVEALLGAEDAEQRVDVALAGEVQARPDVAPRRHHTPRVPGEEEEEEEEEEEDEDEDEDEEEEEGSRRGGCGGPGAHRGCSLLTDSSSWVRCMSSWIFLTRGRQWAYAMSSFSTRLMPYSFKGKKETKEMKETKETEETSHDGGGRRGYRAAPETDTKVTHMVPEVVGTMGMSSASVGMDQGIWN